MKIWRIKFDVAKRLESNCKKRKGANTFLLQLQNILHKALDDFNYDDSSIASSTNVSVASMSGVNKDYRDAMPNEQLKVLYEVKVREIEALKLEYNGFKLEKKKEVDELKNRLFVGEAELQQIKESVKNAEALLGKLL